MLYILDEDELNELREDKLERSEQYRATLLDLCRRVANSEYATDRIFNKREPARWGCILSKEQGSHHCGGCPVKDVCPHDKKYFPK